MPYEQSAPAGGYESYACMQEDTYQKSNPQSEQLLWEAKEGASPLLQKCHAQSRPSAGSRGCLFITIP